MRIVIDMQGAQTESRFRGIGRYTLSFAQAVVRNRGEHEVLLALSGLFPDTIEPIRAAFDGLLPQENIRVWHAPGPVRELESENGARREVAELMREAFLASLQADVIHVSSLFEGYVDDAVTSIRRFDKQTLVSVTLYDLIPLLNPDQYLKPNPSYAAYYERKVNHLRQADTFLAISEHARQEGLQYLGVDENRVVNVSTAIEPTFQPVLLGDAEKSTLLRKLGVSRPFVLYTGGSDERKNLPRLIEAWSKLPPSLRQAHQLLMAGRMPDGHVSDLKQTAKAHGLADDELIIGGYVSDDELIQLYSLCKLFVFPSWHEGFGLPALEAMACGAPVIGANTSSLPEVIGLDEALFDPINVDAISNKIASCLSDDAFLATLKQHGQTQCQRFSWDDTAQEALGTWAALTTQPNKQKASPVGMADAANALINAIAPHMSKASSSALSLLASHLARNAAAGIERQLLVDISELCQHDAATGVQRVVRSYLHHLLQNPPRGFNVQPVYATLTEGYRYARAFTAKMAGQESNPLEDSPIHWQRGDIFFGLDMQHHVQLAHTGTFTQLRNDGVVVKFLVYDLLPIQLADFFKDGNAKDLHEQLLALIAAQDEAICISKATAEAFDHWVESQGIKTANNFRTTWVHMGADLEGSKPSTGLPSDTSATLQTLRKRPTFLAVSTLEPRKAQGQILDAVEHLWAQGHDVNLVLVGQQGWKVETLVEHITGHPELGKRLFWLKGISDEYLERVYQASTCLVAASINEGFGLPLIEAARHGIPVIARDIPVFREVAGDAAYYFHAEDGVQLATALNDWLLLHSQGSVPPSTGMQWSTWQQSTEQLKTALTQRNYPRRQLLVDISELVQRDARTGIQRVVRSILNEWLICPPDGFRVEPVYATIDAPYRYAKKFTRRFLGLSFDSIEDEPMEYQPGDKFLGLDLNHYVPRVHRNYLHSMHLAGVDVRFVIYDLLPIQFPQFWEPQHNVHTVVDEWMSVISQLGGAICISKSVARDFNDWRASKGIDDNKSFKVDWFHLGADTIASIPTTGLPDDSGSVLSLVKSSPSFLMVGTLEPRKGHEQVLDAFEQLWQSGTGVNLVIVGKQGWMMDQLSHKLRNHEQLGKHLFWLEGISDEYLEKVYAASTCLIAASYGEGFGLPLIEAAQHKIPIIARDIPVFREVAGPHAFYFDSTSGKDLSDSISVWLTQYKEGQHPRSDDMPWLTWKQSAEILARTINTTDVQMTEPSLESVFPLRPELPLPYGVSEEQLFDFVTSVRVQDAPEEEMRAYGTHDFRRFVYTWGLTRDIKGKCLELGGNPYFTTMLLKKFSTLDIDLANYFGHSNNGEHTQAVDYTEISSNTRSTAELKFQHFNIEEDSFPYPDDHFELVIFAEIIEHLLNDPCKVLREIKRVLKPNGTLILTTPNVARLENVARFISGANIYDPYSGYGPYGRHNREYNRHELDQLLRFEGYQPDVCFTADVHHNSSQTFCNINRLAELVKFREHDLGQYIFMRATALKDNNKTKRPSWLYRSYPDGELE